jgi:thiamine-phosphate pyrophosphorylase
MLLIIITPEVNTPNEIDIINQLFAKGLQRLHIRKPHFTIDEYRGYIKAIDQQYHSKLVLCGAFELWNEFKLGGVHLNSEMRNDEQIWDSIEDVPVSALSTSFHSWDEIVENGFPYKYVFIGPVFDSISKADHLAAVELAGAKETKAKISEAGKRCPALIALSGVGVTDMKFLHKNGFDGAAMLGTIWQSNNPVITFNAAMNAISGL